MSWEILALGYTCVVVYITPIISFLLVYWLMHNVAEDDSMFYGLLVPSGF